MQKYFDKTLIVFALIIVTIVILYKRHLCQISNILRISAVLEALLFTSLPWNSMSSSSSFSETLPSTTPAKSWQQLPFLMSFDSSNTGKKTFHNLWKFYWVGLFVHLDSTCQMGLMCSQSQASMIELPFSVFKSLSFGTDNLFLVTETGNGIKRSVKIDLQTVLVWKQHALSLHLTIWN